MVFKKTLLVITADSTKVLFTGILSNAVSTVPTILSSKEDAKAQRVLILNRW